MAYYSRVLSKDEEFPSLDELQALLAEHHSAFKLTVEDGEEEEWESLLLQSDDEVEVAVIERSVVEDGSLGQDQIADLLEDLEDGKPESGVAWVKEFLDEVQTVYSFQHLQGSETEEGGNALHALRAAIWERGDSIMQTDHEGFTNEEGFHVVWQFDDSISGPWNMGVLQDGTWYHFKMDLGDPDHRTAFLNGEMPSDLTAIPVTGSRE